MEIENTKEYEDLAQVTSPIHVPESLEAIQARIRAIADDPKKVQMFHGAIGLATEAGELLDMFKKHIFYGKELDIPNATEEVGDGFWYGVETLMGAGFTMLQVMTTNIKKLEARFQGKFTEHRAKNRDLGAERAILEEGTKSNAGHTYQDNVDPAFNDSDDDEDAETAQFETDDEGYF